MKIKQFLSSLTAVVIGFSVIVPGALAAAFGVSPPHIVNENIKPGSKFVYVIDLSTNDPSIDMAVESRIMGDTEISDWLTIRNKDSLIMPKGEKHTPMYVEVNVPEDARVGRYKGSIRVKVIPKETSQMSDIAILLGGSIDVDLNVINYDVADYWIKTVTLDPITTGQPLSLNIYIKNIGNIPIDDINMQVELSDHRTGDFVAKGSGSKLITPVYPHTMKEAEMAVNIPDLEPGNYWAKVNVFKGRESVYQNRLYLTVNDLDANNALKTTVDVVKEKQELKAAAIDTSDFIKKNVSVQTSVTVRAPLTNQLIGVVIALLGIIIIVISKMYTVLKKRRR